MVFLVSKPETFFVYVEILKTMINFTIFPQNHILDERLEWNRKPGTEEPIEKYMDDGQVAQNIELLIEVYGLLKEEEACFDQMRQFQKALAIRDLVRTHVFSLVKLLKGIAVSYELLGQARAQRISKSLKSLLKIVEKEFPTIYKLTRLKRGFFPKLFSIGDSEDSEGNVENAKSKMVSMIPKKFREKKEVGNPWLLEVRTICFQIVDFLNDSFIEEDQYLLETIKRKVPIIERHRRHLSIAHQLVASDENSKRIFEELIFEKITRKRWTPFRSKLMFRGFTKEDLLKRLELHGKYEKLKQERLDNIQNTKFFKIISYSVESQVTPLLFPLNLTWRSDIFQFGHVYSEGVRCQFELHGS